MADPAQSSQSQPASYLPDSQAQLSRPQTHVQASDLRSSQADVWYLKEISFHQRRTKIITQNFNGPCSFIAICNILILRNNITIEPPTRTTVSYEFLAQLVGEYLLMNCPDIDISAALEVMPSTTKGLDLNPLFTGPTSFRPTGGDGGELSLFARANIPLLHGWLVDPASPEAGTMRRVGDYDSAVTLIAEADFVTRGRLLFGGEEEAVGGNWRGTASSSSQAAGSSSQGGAGPSSAQAGPSSPSDNYSEQERRKIEDAMIAQSFLESTKSQLTYHGLFQLASLIEPGTLVALFRNSHLSVLYKPPRQVHDASLANANTNTDQDGAIFSLVTDAVFLREPSVVWERLEDVDGGCSTFVDSEFARATPMGGDWAGIAAFGIEDGAEGVVDPVDHALARQLQAEEDERAHEVYMQRERQRAARQPQQQGRRRGEGDGDRESKKSRKLKEKCIIM
ncbi:DUF544-domain-containing protein [Leucogyrophana mollusca]|uniref:DUF544-domain-containing protein n=1 Tax=Leucogyrophana mollusca TaxID=85980 RepID=A0ACB8BNC2_9AGAM|nr:DUF544-domain-containing protein [Leucogyrophana mollusca]